MDWERGDFHINSDQNRVDIDALHAMLRQTYWAKDRSRDGGFHFLSFSLCRFTNCDSVWGAVNHNQIQSQESNHAG
jgi:hypothetical protein